MNWNKFFKILTIIVAIICISIVFYLYKFEGLRIIENPQRNYAKYMINKNDELIELMIEFESKTEDIREKEFTDEDIESLSNIIITQNEIIKEMQRHPPDESNQDYQNIYDNFLKTHAFFIQGQLMKMEYLYANEEVKRQETAILGQGLSNMMGNIVIEMGEMINDVRNTDIEFKYSFKKDVPTVKSNDSEIIDISPKE